MRATVALAGVYQFTPLKYLCLDKCRSPLSFVIEHWHGGDESAAGASAGRASRPVLRRLLLVADAADVRVGDRQPRLDARPGRGDGVEKNLPWGRRLSAPLGIALVAWGVVLVVTGSPGPGGVQ